MKTILFSFALLLLLMSGCATVSVAARHDLPAGSAPPVYLTGHDEPGASTYFSDVARRELPKPTMYFTGNGVPAAFSDLNPEAGGELPKPRAYFDGESKPVMQGCMQAE